MTDLLKSRLCSSCGKPLRGRVDKKFCDDYCRSYHNNRINGDNEDIRRVNTILKKNRKILMDIFLKHRSVISKFELLERGYNFKYHTNIENRKGEMCFYCYEYGIVLKQDECVAVLNSIY